MLEHESYPATVWWQTGLHILLSFILIIPAVFLAGLLVMIMDFIHEGYIGKTGEGIGFVMRGIQYGIASFAAIGLPDQFLKRSNSTVAVTVFVTIATLFSFIVIAILYYNPAPNADLYSWAESLASLTGLVLEGIIYLQERRSYAARR